MALSIALIRDVSRRLVLVVAVAALAGSWYLVARQIADAKPVSGAYVPPTGIIWGDRVFSSGQTLAVWLHRRGASYVLWAKRHPPAAQLLLR